MSAAARLRAGWCACGATVVLLSAAGAQDAVPLRAALPDEALVAIEVDAPAAAVDAVLSALGAVPPGLPDELLARAGAGLVGLRVALGGEPAAWARDLAGGGAVVGLLPAGDALRAVALLRPGDPAAARRWCERHAHRFAYATDGDRLLLAADAATLARVRARGDSGGRWAAMPAAPQAAVRATVDLAAVRARLGAGAPSLQRLPGGARFLAGALVHALETADVVHFGIDGGDRLLLVAAAPTSVRTAPLAPLWPAASQALPALPADGLLRLRLDRSVAALLGAPERYLAAADVLAVQGFLSIADALDGARTSFVADLLGGLGDTFALYALAAPPVEAADEPPLRLPGLALVATLRDAAAEPVLFRTAQVLATIANAERLQRGQGAFVLRSQRSAAGRGLVAEPPPWRGPGRPPIDRALSPTLWCERGLVVLASTPAAAAAVLASPADSGPAAVGDELRLCGAPLAAAIVANRELLALARVLDEGEPADAARRFVDALVALAGAVQALEWSTEVDAGHTTWRLSLERRR